MAIPASPTHYPLVIVETTPDDADAMIGRLTLLGAEAIEERDATTLVKSAPGTVALIASFAARVDAEQAIEQLGSAARFDEVIGDAWRDGWREHWRPTRLGSRLVVVPTWISYDASPQDIVLRLDPGRAFGTGQHASTALAVDQIEKHVANAGNELVLDVGCGSGILSFVSLLLGARRAIACDLDRESVIAAGENALALGLGDRIDLRVGTVDVVPERSRLVVANIEAGVLVPAARSIAERVADGGVLILSGILNGQQEAVRQAYGAQGLAFVSCAERDEWVAPTFARAG